MSASSRELPEPAFENAIQQIEEETGMSYVASIERVRLKREREEGKVEGKTEGYAALLSTQIARKFGTLPDWAKVRLVAADDITLNRWAEQILDAQRIEDVFK
ncbi:transposase [Alcaligenaceae bacterium]|nr:transposase [Alcaligenaceae bacterium]